MLKKFDILIIDIFLTLVYLGCETANKYKIKNSMGQDVFYAVEG